MSESTTPDEDGDDLPVDFDDVLDLCRDRHRRIALAVLVAEERPLTVRDLTEAIVRHDHRTRLAEVSDRVLTGIQTRLHHSHLPRVEAAGIVEYDPERRVVEPTETFRRWRSALSTIVDADPGLDPPVGLVGGPR